MRVVTLVVALLAGLFASVVAAPDAHADWDPQRFIELRNEAQTLYNDAKYAEALDRYEALETMIADALTADEIPEAQETSAREGLQAVRYQIGRTHQNLGDCKAALSTYMALNRTKTVPEIRAKTAARVAETRLCLAEENVDKDEREGALAVIAMVQDDLAALPEAEGLSEDARTLLRETREQVSTTLDALRTKITNRYLAETRAALEEERCEPARETLAGASNASAGIPAPELADLEIEVDEMCQRVADEEAERMAATEELVVTDPLPLGPIILVSSGAALLIADGIFEATEVSDQVDRFDRYDASCRARGVGCGAFLDARDDLEVSRAVSGTLIGVGSAAIVAGATWWIIDATGVADEPSAPRASGVIMPRADGAYVGLTVTTH